MIDISRDLLEGVRTFGDAGRAWLDALPSTLDRVAGKWDVVVDRPGPPGSCSYIAIVRRRGGERAVIKIPIPHREADTEFAALRAWDGEGAAKLMEFDASGAMLLELVEPGTPLAEREDCTEVARIGGALVRRLHRPAPDDRTFESLADVLKEWAEKAKTRVRALGSRDDYGIIDQGAELLELLPSEANERVLLHGDFHHWNVLAATREPWLAIDPKPMVGDPTFDAAQFLWNHHRFVKEPGPFLHDVHAFADAAGFDADRMLQYAFAKAAEDATWELSIGRREDAARTLVYARFIKALMEGTR